MNIIILLPIVLAIILGAITTRIKHKNDDSLISYSLGATTFVATITMIVLFAFSGESFTLVKFNHQLALTFKIDGLSMVFVTLVSFLWPLATLYASKYMTHEGGLGKFFTYYLMTYGVVIGLAFSGDMLTMYLFYECLTFITLPLVVHHPQPRDLYAGKKYILYSVSGAAISFSGMMLFIMMTGSWNFTQNPFMELPPNDYLYISYLLMFIGFSFKAGLFPFHRWLVAAGVAPTTVTALLHAVAVVKSGAFATMRVTYYLFDPSYLAGTLVQQIVMAMAVITILFGSSTAMRNKHIKRRFAYSTISQLSYILLAVTTMSTLGLVAGLLHMIFHALIKIVIFYTAGNAIFSAHSDYVSQIEGCGKVMKTSFVLFTISSLALIGLPPFGGFVSKFTIAQSAIATGSVVGYIAVAALVISALLTAMYLLQIATLAFMPHDNFDYSKLEHVKESPWEMVLPMGIITVVMIIMSLFSTQLISMIYNLVT